MYLQSRSQVISIQFLFLFFFFFQFFQLFSPSSISSTVAPTTFWCFMEIVDIEGSTVFYNNIYIAFAICIKITKADLSFDFTIFHCRMSTIQPTWPVCTTFIGLHTRCWHFCSSISHKSMPSHNELIVTQRRTM